MKNFLVTIIAFAIAVALGFQLYKKFPQESSSNEPNDTPNAVSQNMPEYPADVSLVNSTGQQLYVILHGKTETHVEFTSKRDGQNFIYAINELAPKSQQLVASYPLTASGQPSPNSKSTVELYVEGLEKEISKIDTRCSQIMKEYNASPSKITRRTLKNEYEELQATKIKLENDILAQQ